MQESEFISKFKEALEIEDGNITITTVFRDLDEWDSLAELSLIAMLDEDYQYELESQDLERLKTIGDLIRQVELK